MAQLDANQHFLRNALALAYGASAAYKQAPLNHAKFKNVADWKELEPFRDPVSDTEGFVAAADDHIVTGTVTVASGGSSWARGSNWDEGKFHVDVNDDEPATVSISAPGYTEEVLDDVRPSDTTVRPLEFPPRLCRPALP